MKRDEKHDDQATPDAPPDDTPTPDETAPENDSTGTDTPPPATDPTDTADAEDGAQGQEDPSTGDDTTGDEGKDGKAAYRRRAQAAEQRVVQLEAQLAQVREQGIARIAETQRRPDFPLMPGHSLIDGTQLFTVGGYDPASLTDPETGAINVDAVAEAVAEVLSRYPNLRRAGSPKPAPTSTASTIEGASPGDVWNRALNRGR